MTYVTYMFTLYTSTLPYLRQQTSFYSDVLHMTILQVGGRPPKARWLVKVADLCVSHCMRGLHAIITQPLSTLCACCFHPTPLQSHLITKPPVMARPQHARFLAVLPRPGQPLYNSAAAEELVPLVV